MQNSAMPDENDRSLTIAVGISQVLGIAMIIFVGIWTGNYLGGYAWDGSTKEFNVHPLCMVLGFVFMYGEAILVYRVVINVSKLTAKIMHGVFHTLAFVAVVIGLVAVFSNHNHTKKPNMYSLHSWLGISTVCMFSLQLLFGFLSFLFPGISKKDRSTYLPIHHFAGILIFVLMGATVISGIDEKLTFSKGDDAYGNLKPKAIIGNILGLLVISYIVCIAYIVHNPKWRRPAAEEEEELSIYFRQVSSHLESDSD